MLDKLNLNLLELLSVLLPGGLMLMVLTQLNFPDHDAIFSIDTKTSIQWHHGLLIFGLSYFLGYVCYVGSSFLDKLYNYLKVHAVGEQVKYASDTRLTSKDIKAGWRWFIPNVYNTHNLINEVIKLKSQYLDPSYSGPNPIDAFQWSYRFLMIHNPTMLAEVERYYATAKFFRSMIFVLFVGGWILLFDRHTGWAVILFCTCLLSLWLFLERWQKANHVAFKNVIIWHGNETFSKRIASQLSNAMEMETK